ncbi:MAG: glycosyltransferase [Ignisphaera sp.]
MDIVMSMITRDSTEKVGEEAFYKVWKSSLQIPYKLIILVDDSISSRTRDFVKRFADEHGKELIVLKSRLYGYHKATRATARQTAIDIFFENTKADWLFFQDDDFVLGDGWWEKALQHISQSDVGLIWGIDYTPYWRGRIEWMSARGFQEKSYAIQNFAIRGGLHDTLLRREAIEGVRLPPWLHVYEDAWIKRYVECKGFKWIIIDVNNIHLRYAGDRLSKEDFVSMAKAASLLNLKTISLSQVLKVVFGLPGYIYYSSKAYKSLGKGITIWRERASYYTKYYYYYIIYLLKRTRKFGNRSLCDVVLHGITY